MTDTPYMDARTSKFTIVMAFFAGAAAATVAHTFLLFGPGGTQRRRRIAQRIDEAKERSLEGLEDVARKGRATAAKAARKVEDSASDIADDMEEGEK